MEFEFTFKWNTRKKKINNKRKQKKQQKRTHTCTKNYKYTFATKTNQDLKQGLPLYSTIVQREFKHIAYALLFSRRSDCDKHTCQRVL